MTHGLIVDLFAGGGGASVAAEIGRPVNVERFASLVQWADGEECWEWRGYRQRRPSGALSYGLFCIGKRSFLAHRMAYMLVHGWIGSDVVIRHRCDNVACVRPDHLIPGTQTDNMADMWGRGRGCPRAFPTGESHPKAKLNADLVREIRALRESTGLSLAKIGERYDLSPTTVHQIVRRQTWREVSA